jgi:integrase
MVRYREQWDRFADWMKAQHPDRPALRDVTPEIAGKYSAELAKKVGPATFNKHTALLTLVFRVLAGNKDARLTCNPFADVGRRQATPNSRRELTVEEFRRVCAAATGELRTLLAIGTYTGLRLGDAATLRWQEVDLIRGAIIRVPHKAARKNPKPVTVPLHPDLAAMLAETPEKQRRGYVLPKTAALYQKDCPALSNQIQAHFTANGVQTVKEGTGFATVTDETGKPKEKHTGKRAVVEVGFHSLRHTFVTLCRIANVPLAVVEAIVGHSSPAMTRNYTHIGEAAARRAVDALPGLTDDAPVLPATTTTGKLDALPTWAREAADRALAALGKSDLATVRQELEKLTVTV